MRQSWETMTSVPVGHIILTPTQPVGSGRPQRESNPGPPLQESRALPQSYRAPQVKYVTNSNFLSVAVFHQFLKSMAYLQYELTKVFLCTASCTEEKDCIHFTNAHILTLTVSSTLLTLYYFSQFHNAFTETIIIVLFNSDQNSSI